MVSRYTSSRAPALKSSAKSRNVTIHHFELLAFSPGAVVAQADVLIRCSKGTYVRSLAESLGAALNLPAHVSALRRDNCRPPIA